MGNMDIYEKVKSCPPNALRTIQAGKLRGKSDINPMWRIKTLTEQFGPCGVGWKLSNVKYWTEPGADGEVAAWCSLHLHINIGGQWSEGIEGIGGSMLVNTEKGKLVTNDEAYKMAQTDAVSVCCKMLGFAADVYWEADRTKYTCDTEPAPQSPPAESGRRGSRVPPPEDRPVICDGCGMRIPDYWNGERLIKAAELQLRSMDMHGRTLCTKCGKAANG